MIPVKGKMEKRKQFLTVVLVVVTALLATACTGEKDEYAFIKEIRTEHPRMLINPEILEKVKAKAAGDEKELFEKLKAQIDANIGEKRNIHYQVYEGILPSTMLIYFVTGEKKYLEHSLQILKDGVQHVEDCYKQRKTVGWFSFARIGLYLGYDWLYDHLTPEERTRYGTVLMQNVLDVQAPADEKDRIKGENYFGYPAGGFYSTYNLFWYAGLAFYNDGINDSLAEAFIREGYDKQVKVMEYRGKTVADDGGFTSIAYGYVMGAYPRAEWNFFHTWASALGENIAPRWTHLAMLPNWVGWNVINDGTPKGYGSGDVYHKSNGLKLNILHLAQIIHFYKETHPEYARLAKSLIDLASGSDYVTYHWSGWYPFLVDTDVAEYEGSGPDATWPHARFFEVLGQVFMRSGFGPDDTYCLFTTDADVKEHRHFDDNNFVIYKKGFQAIDTGTRDHGPHTTEYYNRTVAHNCVLIKKPGEKFPHHWGTSPKMNDGGQNNPRGAVLKAYETNDEFTYLVSDATASYDSTKAGQVVRQFLFVYPDHFIILDRVKSTRAEYAKTWLLHTQNEPVVTGNLLRVEEGGGALFCKTLLPAEAQLNTVGGPGKEFLVDGKNFPVKEGFDKKFREKNPGKEPLFGQWRLEVTPAKKAEEDVFLHVLQVGEKGLKEADKAVLTENGDEYRVTIAAAAGKMEIRFSKDDMMSGGITITKGSAASEYDFSKDVQKQAGLAKQ